GRDAVRRARRLTRTAAAPLAARPSGARRAHLDRRQRGCTPAPWVVTSRDPLLALSRQPSCLDLKPEYKKVAVSGDYQRRKLRRERRGHHDEDVSFSVCVSCTGVDRDT